MRADALQEGVTGVALYTNSATASWSPQGRSCTPIPRTCQRESRKLASRAAFQEGRGCRMNEHGLHCKSCGASRADSTSDGFPCAARALCIVSNRNQETRRAKYFGVRLRLPLDRNPLVRKR